MHLKGQKFDIIIIISVLEHLNNHVNILHLFRLLLKPNGILLIIFPTLIWLKSIVISCFSSWSQPQKRDETLINIVL